MLSDFSKINISKAFSIGDTIRDHLNGSLPLQHAKIILDGFDDTYSIFKPNTPLADLEYNTEYAVEVLQVLNASSKLALDFKSINSIEFTIVNTIIAYNNLYINRSQAKLMIDSCTSKLKLLEEQLCSTS